MNSLLLLEGGHKSLLQDINPSEVEHTITDARLHDHEFVYFQVVNYGDNGYAVDPRKVVAVVGTEHPR